MKRRKWWFIGLALALLAACVLFVFASHRKEVVVNEIAVRTWEAPGERYAELENLSESLMMVPNRGGFFLFFVDPDGPDALTDRPAIDLTAATLLPPGGTLRIRIMDSYEPMFVKLQKGSYLPEVETLARKCKAILWTAPRTPFP